MKEKNVCKICFGKWLTEPLRTGAKPRSMTGEDLMNSDFSFDTEEGFIAHLKEKHNIKVKGCSK